MTDNKIIKALEVCNCDTFDLVLDLINLQKAEIERLKDWENLFRAEKHTLIKKEAIREFAEALCEDRMSNDPVVIAVKCELKKMEGLK